MPWKGRPIGGMRALQACTDVGKGGTASTDKVLAMHSARSETHVVKDEVRRRRKKLWPMTNNRN
jgi:hypothetical protein